MAKHRTVSLPSSLARLQAHPMTKYHIASICNWSNKVSHRFKSVAMGHRAKAYRAELFGLAEKESIRR
jgi:hypothetical protein